MKELLPGSSGRRACMSACPRGASLPSASTHRRLRLTTGRCPQVLLRKRPPTSPRVQRASELARRSSTGERRRGARVLAAGRPGDPLGTESVGLMKPPADASPTPSPCKGSADVRLHISGAPGAPRAHRATPCSTYSAPPETAACLPCSCRQRRALQSSHASCLPSTHKVFPSCTATADPLFTPATRNAQQGTRALRHPDHRARWARARRDGPRQRAAWDCAAAAARAGRRAAGPRGRLGGRRPRWRRMRSCGAGAGAAGLSQAAHHAAGRRVGPRRRQHGGHSGRARVGQRARRRQRQQQRCAAHAAPAPTLPRCSLCHTGLTRRRARRSLLRDAPKGRAACLCS